MKLKRPLVVFDVETTGTNIEEDRIVELAWVKLHPDRGRETKSTLINPGMPIPIAAKQIHGIDDASVQDAPSFRQVSNSVLEQLTGCDVGGYNCTSFDVEILRNEFKRVGIEWPTVDVRIVDAYKIWMLQEPRSLEDAVEVFCDRTLDEAHSAEADVEATVDVLFAQAKHYQVDDFENLYELGRDPSWLDAAGKIRLVNDEPCLSFGKPSGKPLKTVDPDYLKWMLNGSFPEDTKELIRWSMRS